MKANHLSMLLFAASLVAARADFFGPLSTRFSGTTQNLYSVTWGGDTAIAVGDHGTILGSVDTVTWTLRPSPTHARLTGVVYGAAGFVAVGDQPGGLGTILTSSDGVTWAQQVSPVTNKLSAVCYSSGLYVAVGSRGMILTSSNGVAWAMHSTGAPYDLNGVAPPAWYSGATNFVAVGDSGTILTSDDGLAWTARFSGLFVRLNGIISGIPHEKYLAVGDAGTLATSSDNGISWTARSSGVAADLYSAGLEDSQAITRVIDVTGDGGTLLTSSDAIQWTAGISGTTSLLRAIAYGKGAFVSVGDSGSIQAGVPWMTLAKVTSLELRAIACANSNYVIAGGDDSHAIILTSANQTDWALVYSNSIGFINKLTFDGNRFQAAGNGQVLSSADRVNWTVTVIGPTNLNAIACGNGICLAAGYYPGPFVYLNPASLRSTDGVTWVPVGAPPFVANAMAFGNNLFVAVGYVGQGAIATTSDGVVWTSQTNPGSDSLSAVTYASGMFVAGGPKDVLLSPDGTNWSKIAGASSGPSIAFGTQGFVSPCFFTSPDGTNWSSHAYPDHNILSLVFAGNAYLGVSQDGAVVRSLPWGTRAQPVLTDPAYRSSGFEMNAIAAPGYNYRVQKSPAPPTSPWIPVTSFISTQAVTHISDPAATNAPAGFYRIVSP